MDQAILLLHGLTGDENSMLVFASHVPASYWIFSIRAPHAAAKGGYSWVLGGADEQAPLDRFQPGVEALQDFLEVASLEYPVDFERVHLMGFSQGAALSYTFASLHPERAASIVGLSGFLPSGLEQSLEQRLVGLPVFMAHGTLDERIPVAEARHAAGELESAGAQVVYCEDEVGHKLSASCMRAMGHFYGTLTPG
jgi:phospholipase/carboxylesterase